MQIIETLTVTRVTAYYDNILYAEITIGSDGLVTIKWPTVVVTRREEAKEFLVEIKEYLKEYFPKTKYSVQNFYVMAVWDEYGHIVENVDLPEFDTFLMEK